MKRVALVVLAAIAACVPADGAQRLGGIQFTLGATAMTREGIPASAMADGYSVRFERVVLGFKTMTIGKVGTTDTCSYRGSAAQADAVYDPRIGGVVQQFNGIQPVVCPDVGIIFGAPDGATIPADTIPSAEIVELAEGAPSHALIDAVATSPKGHAVTIHLRFETARTASRFGGCHVGAARGISVLADQRPDTPVLFGAENLFREFLADDTADLRAASFVLADTNGDDQVTMAELDGLPLARLGEDAYQLADGTQNGSFGQYLRQLFRFTVYFGSMQGQCIGNDPSVPE